jgi:hypothetical protein
MTWTSCSQQSCDVSPKQQVKSQEQKQIHNWDDEE